MRKFAFGSFLGLFLLGALIIYPVHSATITVCASGCDYTIVKDAVDNANPGDTILVGAGTYIENNRIDVTKNLTIIGAGASATILRPGFNTTGTHTPSTPDESFIYVAPNVTLTLRGVAIDGAGWQVHIAIQSRGTVIVEDCAIRNIRHSQYYGRGVAIYAGTQNVVRNCTLSNIERIYVFVRGTWFTPNPSAHIEGSTIIGKGDGDLINYGIELGAGGQATILNNTISGFRGFASGRWNSAGIFTTTVYGPGTRATVYGNTIYDCSFGIHVGYRSTVVDTSVVEATCNNIAGNVTGLHSTGPPVNARGNWWGSDTGPFHAVLNPAGMGNPVSDNVDFLSWLAKAGCGPLAGRRNSSYLLSMLPAAVNHISEAHALQTEAESLLSQAKSQGKDASECEVLLEEARMLVDEAENLIKNPIRANNLALVAIQKLKQAMECLKALLG